MMRLVLAAGASALLLAACSGGAGKVDPAEVCTSLLAGDTDISTDLAEFGADVDSYCGCYASQIDDLSEDDRAAVLKVSQVMADLREDRGLSVENAADLIDADPDGATHGVTRDEFETAGEFVDEVRNQIRDNDGKCPA